MTTRNERPKINLPTFSVEIIDRLSKLPLEDTISQVVDGMFNRITAAPPVQQLSDLINRVPVVESVTIPTPLGPIITPPLSLPDPVPPELSEDHKAALKASIGVTLAQLVGLVPGIGDVIADTVEDVYQPRIRAHLTAAEFEEFIRQDKIGPAVLAMLRTLSKARQDEWRKKNKGVGASVRRQLGRIPGFRQPDAAIDFSDVEPDEDSITTQDEQNWFQYGKLYVTGDRMALWRTMVSDNFFPDVFVISDHGNAHLISGTRDWYDDDGFAQPLPSGYAQPGDVIHTDTGRWENGVFMPR